MGLIIRNSGGMFHYYAPSTISSGQMTELKLLPSQKVKSKVLQSQRETNLWP